MPATIAQAPVKYNDIPKESKLLTRIKPLGKDDHVKYRVLGSTDPSKPGKLFGPTTILPTIDTVSDPDTGEVYDIAYVQSFGQGGAPIIGDIILDDFNRFTITLKGSSTSDRRKYQYLELCNYLVNNPDRDTNKTAYLERVDEVEDFKYKRDRRKKVQSALMAVENMTDNEVINFIRVNRLPDPGTNESRRAAVEDLAEKSPDKFAKLPTVDYTSLYDTIDEAKKAKVIVWNNVTREWTRFSGELLVQVKKGFGISNKEELAQYLMKDGKADLTWINAELAKAK